MATKCKYLLKGSMAVSPKTFLLTFSKSFIYFLIINIIKCVRIRLTSQGPVGKSRDSHAESVMKINLITLTANTSQNSKDGLMP